MSLHVIEAVVDPTAAPTEVGQLWVNTATKARWESVGTLVVADWLLEGHGSAISIGLPVTGATDGAVLFVDGGLLAEDPAQLFWDNTNNRLGIGTNSPNGCLGLNGGVAATDVAILEGTITMNNAGVAFSLLKLDVTDNASDVESLMVDIQVGASLLWGVRKDGAIVAPTVALQADSLMHFMIDADADSATQYFRWATDTATIGGGTELMRLDEAGLLSFGGVTSSFPALKRSGTSVLIRLADDSGYGNFIASIGQATTYYTSAVGSAGAPAYQFSTAATYGMYQTGVNTVLSAGGFDSVIAGFLAVDLCYFGSAKVRVDDATLHMDSAYSLGWSSGAVGSVDLRLYRGAAGILEQSNLTTTQELRVYKTTDGVAGSHTNYERLAIGVASNRWTLASEAGGTGTKRDMAFGDATAGTALRLSPVQEWVMLLAEGNIYWHIDSDNNASGKFFEWAHNSLSAGAGTQLMKLTDGGVLTLNSQVLGPTDLGEVYLASSLAITVASTAVWYVVESANITLGGREVNFVKTSNRLAYDGADVKTVLVNASLSFTCASNNQLVHMRIAVNGVGVTSSEVTRLVGTGADVGNAGLCCLASVSNTDDIVVEVRNATGTNNLTIEYINISAAAFAV